MRTLLPILALSLFVSFAHAQRGNTPPGMSQDGAKPADGAIKGGSAAGSTIMPGESGGLPNKDIQRCKELSGSLREDCLKKERDSSAGAGATMPSTPDKPTDILKK
jgi:hypothetical protein